VPAIEAAFAGPAIASDELQDIASSLQAKFGSRFTLRSRQGSVQSGPVAGSTSTPCTA
jgi:hypothetical protein